MYKHVIWDFDGTLFDTYPETAIAMVQALHNHGYESTYQEAYDLMKVSIGTMWTFYQEKFGAGDDVFNEYEDLRKKAEIEKCMPYEGIPELLRDIIAAGGKNYICTHRGGTTFAILKARGLYDLFEGFVTALDGFPAKPDPTGVNHLLKTYNIDPDTAIMVGDRELDIMAGKNAGIKSLAFWDGTGAKVTCADFNAESVDEMRKFIGA
jgi:HAD superfamily hydrolase (TIGR01549 family)